MASIFILGRQPAIGRAELESLYGASTLSQLGSVAARVNINPSDIQFANIGGSVKLCKELTSLPSSWEEIELFLISELPKHLRYIPEGKIKLGLSVYGKKLSLQRIQSTALALKRTIKQAGRSIRIVPNKAPALNAAQVLNNKLTDELGMELNIIFDGHQAVLAQTVAVQDIDAYAARDQKRPKRDARVGMLPPKLAQTIINLARDGASITNILDPFCGTGVILQEALLMGYDAYGTDMEPRMIDFSKDNLEWLGDRYKLTGRTYLLESGDATNYVWQQFELIACETYLGRPFTALPKPEILREVIQDVDTIHHKFLRNVARQTKSGFRMCIAVPAWKTKDGFLHLKTLDSLEELGYTRQSFVHADNRELIYHRENQIVGRELVVLTRK